jgi:hypothetical protein
MRKGTIGMEPPLVKIAQKRSLFDNKPNDVHKNVKRKRGKVLRLND